MPCLRVVKAIEEARRFSRGRNRRLDLRLVDLLQIGNDAEIERVIHEDGEHTPLVVAAQGHDSLRIEEGGVHAFEERLVDEAHSRCDLRYSELHTQCVGKGWPRRKPLVYQDLAQSFP